MKIGQITLRPLQVEAVEKFRNVEAVIVGDDTGGGKTVTSLALVQQIWDAGENGPVLIVTKSFDVWTRHLALMDIDDSRVHVIDPKRRTLFLEEVSRIRLEPCRVHFYIIHWEALPLSDVLPVLSRVRWLCVIADEAHKAKNRKAQRTKALKRLKTRYKIGATATPGDNATPDIWSLLHWLYPKKYTSYWKWVQHYIEHDVHWKGYTIFGKPKPERVAEFQAEIEPFYIGRPLSAIAPEVPEMLYASVEVDMHPLQAQSYQEILDEQMTYLGDDLLVAGTQLEVSQRMHQLANSYGRLEIGERWKVLKSGQKVKVPKYSVRLEEPSTKLDMLMHMLEGKYFGVCVGNEVPLDFRVKPDSNIRKARAAHIMETEPVVVFSTYIDMVDMACKRMDDLGISYVACTGKSELSADEAAEVFQSGKARVFIGTVQTAGESIDLTRARVTIYIDVHWSPRVKKQGDGRTRRIGQTRSPWCIDIKARDTVDFVKLDKVRTKQEWLDAMFGRE